MNYSLVCFLLLRPSRGSAPEILPFAAPTGRCRRSWKGTAFSFLLGLSPGVLRVVFFVRQLLSPSTYYSHLFCLFLCRPSLFFHAFFVFVCFLFHVPEGREAIIAVWTPLSMTVRR